MTNHSAPPCFNFIVCVTKSKGLLRWLMLKNAHQNPSFRLAFFMADFSQKIFIRIVLVSLGSFQAFFTHDFTALSLFPFYGLASIPSLFSLI